MAAYPGRGGTTILIRNHENRSRAGEITVNVPDGKRYDPDVNVRGGNTKLVVGARPRAGGGLRRARRHPHQLRRRRAAVEHLDHLRGDLQLRLGRDQRHARHGVPHGYCFEIAACADGPVTPSRSSPPAASPTRPWPGSTASCTRPRTAATPPLPLHARSPAARGRRPRDLRRHAAGAGGERAAELRRQRGEPGESYAVEWVTIEEPNPLTDTVRSRPRPGRGDLRPHGGHLGAGDRVYFDCTTGGDAELGQVWEYRPRGEDGGELRLIYESASAEDLEDPDNLVVVPSTGDIFLQEDAEDEQYVRGVTPKGQIYDFARTVLNSTEFCGGCFSPDGRPSSSTSRAPAAACRRDLQTGNAVTYAITGPFSRRR